MANLSYRITKAHPDVEFRVMGDPHPAYNVVIDRADYPRIDGKLICTCPTELLATAVVNGLCWADDECGFIAEYWEHKLGLVEATGRRLDVGFGLSVQERTV